MVSFSGMRSDGYFKYYVISIGGLIFWTSVLALKKEIRAAIVTFATSIVLSLYLVEGFLNLTGLDVVEFRTLKAASELGVKFDTRRKLDFINDLRANGVDAVPSIHTAGLIERARLHQKETDLLFPFGGVSNKVTVVSNESGKYMVIQSDRYGFNNPDFEWDVRDTEWLLTGDSFTEGYAVQFGEDIAGQIRVITNQSVLNLGRGGNGPLSMLAALKEYAEIIQPKKVIWLYYEGNDLDNELNQEKEVPLLRRYLQSGFSQDLIHKQKEIDTYLSGYISNEEAKSFSKYRSLRLTGARYLFSIVTGTDFTTKHPVDSAVDVSPLFSEILSEAKNRVESWGGELYFVYLPGYPRYVDSAVIHDSFRKKGKVIESVKKLNIPVIDIHQKVFDGHSDPLSLFPLRLFGHYTADGYREVAQEIISGSQTMSLD
jgi:hypothetical protein